jgi:protein involved in sex pheromone biosynthesis
MKIKRIKERLGSIVLAGALALSLAGCASGNTNEAAALSAEDYAAILPYDTSDSRVKHIGLISDLDVRIEMETGLMDLSKSYFSPSEVAYKSHGFLDYDELDATDGSRGLLGTLRDDNPNGLNPGSGEEFDTGNGVVTGATILVDIYELDFYQNDQLKGISIGLIVNDELDYNDETYAITDEKLQNYLEVTSNKLVSYMRERFNEITSRVPILVAAYKLDSSSSSSNGGYVYSGYFSGSSVSYQSLEQQWVIVPSTEFSTLDATMASQFTTFKEDMANVLPDNTYVTGEAKFEGSTCQKLNIYITAHAKTASEMLAVVQVAKESLSVFENTNCLYTIEVINNNDVYAVLQKEARSNKVNVISLM